MAREDEALQAYNASAWRGFAVTPSDATIFASGTRALWVGGAGDVVVRMMDGNSLTFSAVPAGTLLPIQCDMVKATSTTATNMTALY